jgi:hypothetical protein
MALSPQPLELDPNTFSGVVTHDNFTESPPEWAAYAAKSEGLYLDQSRWGFTESPTTGLTRDATVTLDSTANDQIDLLKAGKQIALYIAYPGIRRVDTLNVCLKK